MTILVRESPDILELGPTPPATTISTSNSASPVNHASPRPLSEFKLVSLHPQPLTTTYGTLDDDDMAAERVGPMRSTTG